MNTEYSHIIYSLAAVLLLVASQAQACPIPVFQFSLEYWETDPYEIEVVHDGEFAEDEQEAIDRLKEARDEDVANIRIRWRDYARATMSPPDDMELPHMKLSYPSTSGIDDILWEGPLEKETVDDIVHSPLRQKIAEKLLDRHAGVWVLLKSGNNSEDRQVEKLLEEELPRLEETLKVPDPSEEYGVDMGDIHTDINFSMITLSRDDSEEQMFIRMLLGSERDLDEYTDEPMVFPIYGRGLIMYALIGDGINEWTLNKAGELLTGPCSCTVKQSNPGVDLVMSFDWETQVEQQSTYSTPGADTGGFIDRMEEAEERLEE